MKVSKEKFELICARKLLCITEVSRDMGTTTQNLNKILNRGECRPVFAGRLAKTLGVDVTEIIE